MPLPPIYSGSTAVACAQCQTPTWQGPRLQEAIVSNPELIFMCYLCAMTTTAAQAESIGDVTIASMGNPYERKP